MNAQGTLGEPSHCTVRHPQTRAHATSLELSNYDFSAALGAPKRWRAIFLDCNCTPTAGHCVSGKICKKEISECNGSREAALHHRRSSWACAAYGSVPHAVRTARSGPGDRGLRARLDRARPVRRRAAEVRATAALEAQAPAATLVRADRALAPPARGRQAQGRQARARQARGRAARAPAVPRTLP